MRKSNASIVMGETIPELVRDLKRTLRSFGISMRNAREFAGSSTAGYELHGPQFVVAVMLASDHIIAGKGSTLGAAVKKFGEYANAWLEQIGDETVPVTCVSDVFKLAQDFECEADRVLVSCDEKEIAAFLGE